MTQFGRQLKLTGAIAVLSLIALGPIGARGDIIVDDVILEEVGDPTYIYTAPSVILTAGSSLFPGDFFTFYDLPGLDASTIPAPSVTNPLLWSASVQTIGRTPDNTPLPSPDDPSILNVTWTYTGAIIDALADRDLGQFAIRFFAVAEGLTPPGLQLVYSAQTHVSELPRGNAGIANVLYTRIVPEPSSMVLMGLALPAMLVSLLRRRRSGA